MTSSQLEKLLFAQGGKCFFCKNNLERSEASVEHLLARANGGSNDINENCVACCKSINSLFGSLPLKNKIEIILNQEGSFKCPGSSKSKKELAKTTAKSVPKETEWFNQVVADLTKRGNARPKKLKTLTSTIAASPKLKGIQEAEVNRLIKKLAAAGKLTIVEEKVTYNL